MGHGGNEIDLNRRDALRAAGVALSLVPLGVLARGALAQTAVPLDAFSIGNRSSGNLCILSAQAVEGPFYLENALIRSDIRDDRQGLPLRVSLTVSDANNRCRPVAGALVSVWMCDAAGYYSGYPYTDPDQPPRAPTIEVGSGTTTAARNHAQERGTARWLRGVQRTDANGAVQFTTIFPGWYAPRAPHIHAKVFLSDREMVTTQCYFPQAVIQSIYTKVPPYAARGLGIYTNENDRVRQQSGAGLTQTFAMSHGPDGVAHASLAIGISHV